ncbi:MAG: hypothetical protein H7831_19130, partial [Magnetococcus sp. WYHC-3]
SHDRYEISGTNVTRIHVTYSPLTVGNCSGSSCLVPQNSSTVVSGEDLDGFGRNLTELRRNIANWYQYHRRRSFVAKNAIARVVTASPGFRYGLSVINQGSTLFVPMPGAEEDSYLAHNDALLQSLYAYDWQPMSTPLRRGLQTAGDYYSGQISGRTSPITQACQQNFAVLFTDGYWNGNDPNLTPDDQDNDGIGNTLADVAHRYYHTDLAPALANQVPASPEDNATHQHMVTFSVAFGITGVLNDSDNDGWPDNASVDSSQPADGTPDEDGNWGNPVTCSDCPEKVDDLWHAAFNGRGTHVSARTPDAVQSALSAALANIAERTSSAASAALNSASLSTTTRLFQARFESGDWTGTLLSYPVNTSTGAVDASGLEWSAEERLVTQHHASGREIITARPDAAPGFRGIALRWPVNPALPGSSELSAAQVAALNDNPDTPALDNDTLGVHRLNHLRGDRSREGTGSGALRVRAILPGHPPGPVLGDIIHSDPVHVGPPSANYPDSLSGPPG